MLPFSSSFKREMSSDPSATTYPPPSRRTLYDSSPHAKKDKQVKSYTDPTNVLLFLLFLAVVYWSFPGIEKPWSVAKKPSPFQAPHTCNCPVLPPPKMVWQQTFTLSSRGKGCHLVTDEVAKNIAEGLKGTKAGILTLFIQHTSASLSINENFDRDVRTDMDMAMDKIVPESLPWKHTDEGPDDSCSHTKASLMGSSITIPITNGKLNLGTWQGVYLCEFRAAKHSRRIVATVLP